MGKSKDDYKRKRSSPSSPPRGGDEGRIKRQKSKEDEKKHKSDKKHKSHKSFKKDKKSDGKRKDKGHKKLKIQELSKEDYFSKNNEFAMWLKEERNIFFSDLSSDKARGLFSEFVAEWNNQKLESQYYEGVATGPRTSHKWNIKK